MKNIIHLTDATRILTHKAVSHQYGIIGKAFASSLGLIHYR